MRRRILVSFCAAAALVLAVLLILSVAVLLNCSASLSAEAGEQLALSLLSALPMILIVLLLLCATVYLWARRVSKQIIDPLQHLNLNLPASKAPYEELKPLLEHVQAQKQRMKEQSIELVRKKNEFDTATNHMSEGLVLLGEHGTILAINRSAVRLFGITTYCIGQKLSDVCPSDGLSELCRRAQNGEHALLTVQLNGQDYQINASPTMTDDRVVGITLLVFDITEKEKAEKMRQEFTANVSHELKTPLHTISGYAELLAGGVAKPEDVPHFSKQIYTEARRMIALVEDIIKLSRLDEGSSETQRESTDLYPLAKATLQSLSQLAKDSNVTLSLQGTSAPLYGIRQFLSIIIYNLCDNAIKYNKHGGSVTVTVTNTAEYAVLSVRDTGIGIPEEAQERIFERFYRVDKSHSKSLGGTGLGLSIVKHAAKLHNAKIKLHSIPDTGTTVTVYFPK